MFRRRYVNNVQSGNDKNLCLYPKELIIVVHQFLLICSISVLRVGDLYFHNGCFNCKGCSNSLSQGGYFAKEKDYFCANCYQANFGTKCAKCNTFVEGEVVTALGKTYHQTCFKCAGCKKPFPTGERVTFTGKNCLCQACSMLQNPDGLADLETGSTQTATVLETSTAPSAKRANDKPTKDGACAGNFTSFLVWTI